MQFFQYHILGLKMLNLFLNERELAQIELVKVYLTFSKFLDKNKMNIQNVVIKKAKFEFFQRRFKKSIKLF